MATRWPPVLWCIKNAFNLRAKLTDSCLLFKEWLSALTQVCPQFSIALLEKGPLILDVSNMLLADFGSQDALCLFNLYLDQVQVASFLSAGYFGQGVFISW